MSKGPTAQQKARSFAHTGVTHNKKSIQHTAMSQEQQWHILVYGRWLWGKPGPYKP